MPVSALKFVSGLAVLACFKIQFFQDTNFTGLIFEAFFGSDCRTVPEQHQNTSVAIRSNACVIVYDDPNCATNGWRISPDSGGMERKSGAWINSYRPCNEVVSFFNETYEPINLPLHPKCQNIPKKYFGAPVSLMIRGRCIQLFSKIDCRGNYTILSGDVDRENLDILSFRACDTVTFFGSDDKELLALSVGTTCQTLPPRFRNKTRTCRPEMDIMVFPQPNCKGHGKRVDSAKGMLDVEYLTMNINSFVAFSEIVQLYTQPMHRGSSSMYVLGPHCQNVLSEDFEKSILSVRSESCVVLYTKLGCRGESLEIQGDAGNHLTDPSFNQARSFHRCQSIKFYIGHNHKGLLYDDTISRECKTLPSVYWNQTKSIKVMHVNYACVKVYSLADCKGYSTNVLFGSGASVLEYIEGVASFKHCHLKAYADFEENEPNPRELGTIESVCKNVSEVNLYSSTTVEVDDCTLFYTHPKCYGDPLKVLHRMNVTLPSGCKWFRSCTKTMKLLGNESLSDIKHQSTISENCIGIPRRYWKNTKFIAADGCVTVYSKAACQGQPTEISAGVIYPFKNWLSFHACKPVLRLSHGSVNKGETVYDEKATEQCTNIRLPETGHQNNEILLATTNDCVRVYKEENCVGDFEIIRFYNESLNFYKSFQSCEAMKDRQNETKSDEQLNYNRDSNMPAKTNGSSVPDTGGNLVEASQSHFLHYLLVAVITIVSIATVGLVIWFLRPIVKRYDRNRVERPTYEGVSQMGSIEDES